MAFPAVASSSDTRPWPFDVFLSFRGADTRNNFTAHLFKALDQKGIYTYMDDKLEGGEEISPALLKAIKESRIAIIVLSENYASSTWCLDELKEILECREKNQQTILPIFYKVLPSDVRYQKNKFGEALAKHTGRYKKEIVQRWKEDLEKVSELSGHHLMNGNESEFIQQIVQLVISRMDRYTDLNVAKYPIGIGSRVQDIKDHFLSLGMSDRHKVGIFGVGGIGKTTIAKEIYNLIADQFEEKCFLANVRENSKQEGGLVQLQNTLLYGILGDSNLKISNVDQGINVIKKRLCNKKVLLVLDDVDQLIQLDTLSGEYDWFGLGSIIIITTRDKHLLAKHKVNLTYKMKELDNNEAVQLFSRHAFGSDKPIDDFVELTKKFLLYVGGLPLALRVVGSNLYGKDINHWESALEKYKRFPNREIYDILKISYDGLEDNEKNIFLDIACFFKGKDAKYVTHILNNCGLFPESGIEVLIDRSLITIEYDNLVMHDLLQDMGREIVRQESPNEIGKRSRLWYHEDVRYVLEANVGTENIKGILLDLPERDLIRWRSNTFENMKSLRYFICRNAEFSEELTYLPNELRVLDWAECPLQYLPSNFHGRKLTILRMHNGLFKGLKEGFQQNLPNLSSMELIGLGNLTEIPDISRIPNLQKLHVFECKNLFKVHDFVGFHDKLTHLSFYNCSNLISLPKSLKLSSPKRLYFQCCPRLETFPEIECKMNPFRLFSLKVEDCRNLIHLPSSIIQLQQCFDVFVSGSPKLVVLPTNVRDEGQSTEESRDLFLYPPLPNSSMFVFSAQTGLKLDEISLEWDELTISGSKIVSLPAWFKTFVRLRVLRLDGCKQLQKILELPANIEKISASGCVSLKSFPQISRENQFNTSQLPLLEWINFSDCYKMANKIRNEVTDFVLDKVHYKDSFAGGIIFPGNKIPDRFRHRMDCPEESLPCTMAIKGLPHLDEIQGIVFCAVLSSDCGIDGSVEFTIRNRGRYIQKRRDFTEMESTNVWYEYCCYNKYIFQESFELKGDCLQVRLVKSRGFTIRSFGVHIIHKHEENANDHPDMSRVESSFCFANINDYWKISSREDESDEERLELSECAKMTKKIGNDPVKCFLFEKVHSKDSFDGGIYLGSRIPDWFHHHMKCRFRTRKCIMNIKGLPHLDEILIQEIVFCAVLEPAYDKVDYVSATFTMRHKGIEIEKTKVFDCMESKTVWYENFVLESFELNGDNLQVGLDIDLYDIESITIRSFGVHIIHKREENANDHPDMTRVESCFTFAQFEEFLEFAPFEKFESLVGSI